MCLEKRVRERGKEPLFLHHNPCGFSSLSCFSFTPQGPPGPGDTPEAVLTPPELSYPKLSVLRHGSKPGSYLRVPHTLPAPPCAPRTPSTAVGKWCQHEQNLHLEAKAQVKF